MAPHENLENKPKLEKSSSQLLIIRDIQIYLLIYVFEVNKKDETSLKKIRITKVVKIQNGRQLWSKDRSWYKIS